MKLTPTQKTAIQDALDRDDEESLADIQAQVCGGDDLTGDDDSGGNGPGPKHP